MANKSLLTLVPMMFATLAWVFGTSFFLNCRDIQFPLPSGLFAIQAGVYGYRTKGVVTTNNNIWVVNTCRPYEDIREDFGFDYEIDQFSETLKPIGISVIVIGCVAMLLSCVGAGVAFNQLIWKFISVCCLTCCILQGLSLRIMNSSLCTNNPVIQFLAESESSLASRFPTECEKNMGWRFALTSTVFWGIATLVAAAIPSPDNSDDSSPPPQKNDDQVEEQPEE